MKLLQRLKAGLGGRAAPEFSAPLEPDQLFYVIGDVHGCDHLLEAILGQIRADAGTQDAQIVCAGDYVDRGENSAAVLRRLFQASASSAGRLVCLAGNHEEMMLRFLDNPEGNARMWFRNGGLQTLASFRVGGASQDMPPAALEAVRNRLLDALGEELAGWLRALPTMWSSGNVNVVHAGADPELPLAKQSRKTLIWGHPAFHAKARTDGQWVVYGHTILPEIRVGQGRIGVDTGAYATGRLSAVRIARAGTKALTAGP